MEKTKRTLLKTSLLLLCLLMGAILFNPTSSHAAATKKGWVTEGVNKYYYRSGQKLLGLQKIGKSQYYFDLKSGSMVKKKWKRINNKYYYFLANGKMATKRWISKKYYVNAKGVRVTNKWVGKRFVGEDGKWIKNFKGGWHQIKGKWYYYTKKGKKKTGWITYKGKKYYLDSDGVRLTKRQSINKKSYQFSSKGVLKTSGWIKSGKWYYKANKNGVLNTKDRMNAKTRSQATIIEYTSTKLKIRLEKKREFNTDYWVARVQTRSAKQIVHAFSYGTYGGTLQRTSDAVTANNAILGINGSAFGANGVPSPYGMCILNGKIYGNYATSYTVMSIMKDGSLQTAPLGVYGKYLLNMGVRDTLNFGPILLENGKTVPFSQQGNDFSLVSYQDPRTAIGMVRPGEYVLVVADGRRSGSAGLNYQQMVSVFKRYGCSYAYNLDGGGSATIAYKGYVLNRPSDKGNIERPCGDFILFKN